MRRVGRTKATVGVLVLFLCLACGAEVFAQSTATLQGIVTDPQGAIVPGAKVTVRSQATGIERTAQTGEDGNYQIASLPPGVYTVEVQAQGFQTQTASNLTVEVARTVVQNFQLTVGSVSQTVTVVSDAPVVETATTSVGQVIDQKTVQEIPLNGRHMVDLAQLVPGTVAPNPATGFLTAPIRGQGALAFNTAGQREDTTNYQINGINLNDMVQNQITFQPSISTLQEFKVDNSTFSAEYGRNSGAIVNVATRSGTNEFHGELFEFFRNEALDARNFFDLRKPPFKRNQYGFSLGGPVLLPHFGEGGPTHWSGKDRTFFFFSFEGLRQRQGLTVNSQVPTASQRAAATDPSTRKLYDLIPLPNAADARGNPVFVGAATAPVDLDQWTLDVSHNIGTNDRLHAYYAYQSDLRRESLSGTTIPGFGDTRKGRRQLFTLNETHTFGPNLVNEARLGANRISISFLPNAALNPAAFGINTGINEAIGLPVINVTSIGLTFGGPGAEPQGRGDTTYVLSDTLNYLRGRHSFKFGGEVRRFLNNNFSVDPGTFTFTNVNTFNAGTASAFAITQGSSTNSITSDAMGLFVQDNFKFRPNVTFELGLRWDWNKTPTERFDRLVNFDPATVSLRRVGRDIDRIYHENNRNFEPRVGVAWDPWGDGKTSVRAAYAVLVEQPVTNMSSALSSNPPLAIPVALPAGTTTTFANALNQVKAGGTIAPTAIAQDFDNAQVQSYNLNVQRQIGRGVGVMVGYFGSKGSHLQITRNLNQFVGGVRPFPRLSASSPILPNTPLTNITYRESNGNSNYNALWATLDKRLSNGLRVNASYTLSKSIDYNSRTNQGIVVQDSNHLRNDRAPSDFDTRHRFVISALYQLPFHGNQLVEGWQLTTITQSQSGNPINILSGNALAITSGNVTLFPAVASNTLTGLGTLRPDLIGPITLHPTGEPTVWFSGAVCDPRSATTCPAGAAFAIPISGTNVFHFGSLGRNAVLGPAFNNTDFSVVKKTRLSEEKTIEFRAEFFDLFNHTNFGQPGRVAQFGSPSFGVINSTRFATGDSGSSRQVQFALKFLF